MARHVSFAFFALTLALVSDSAGAATQPEQDSVVMLTFIEVCPDRSLPLPLDIPRAVRALEARVDGKADRGAAIEPEYKTCGGWRAQQQPNRHVKSYDDYKLAIETNDPSRLKTDVNSLFSAIGFLPVDWFDDCTPAVTDISIRFFGDLAFVHGGPLNAIVVRRDPATGSYEFKNVSPVTEGSIVQKRVAGHDVYFFQEDHEAVLAQMRREYPTARWFAIWAEDGTPVMRFTYDQVEWLDSEILVRRNVSALAAGCDRRFSSLKCQTSGNACQLSLLDPITRQPVVLLTTLHVGFQGEKLVPRMVGVDLAPTNSTGSESVTCRGFDSREEILKHTEFGGCGRNLDGVTEWRCLGNPKDYLEESWEASRWYWSSLYKLLEDNASSGCIDGASFLMGKLHEVRRSCPDRPSEGRSIPHGLGYADSFGLIRVALSHEVCSVR